jgi:beta-glucosidase
VLPAGNEGGRALADILYGDVNPRDNSYNYPRYTNSLENTIKYTESLGDEEQNNDAQYQKKLFATI